MNTDGVQQRVLKALYSGWYEQGYHFGDGLSFCPQILASVLVIFGLGSEYLAEQGVALIIPEEYPQNAMPQRLRELTAQGSFEQRMSKAEYLCRAWTAANPVLNDTLLPLLHSIVHREWSADVMADVVSGLLDSVAGQPAAEWCPSLVQTCFAFPLGETEMPEVLSLFCADVVRTGAEPGLHNSAYDPFCASGTMLAAMRSRGTAIVCGETLNPIMAAIARLRLLLTGSGAQVQCSDALASPAFTIGEKLQSFDYVVSALPRGMEYRMEFAETDGYGRFRLGVPPRQQGEWAYLLHMLAHAEPRRGAVSAFVSAGTLFRSGVTVQAIRRALTEDNLLEAVVALPTCVLPHATAAPMLLVLRKGRTRRTVRFVDAQGLGQRTRRQTLLSPADTDKILAALATEDELPGFARSVTAAEIAAADYVWSVSRYVLPVAEETRIDLPRLKADIERKERELAEKQQQLDAFLAAW